MATDFAKVSVTLPASLLERVRARVGTRGLSGYVAQALEAEEQRAALRAWLAGQDEDFGSVPPELIDEVRHQWLAGDPPAS